MHTIFKRALLALLVGSASIFLASQADAQASELGGCDPDGPTPSFMSVDNEIYYGCGWLFRSRPAQHFQAIGRFQAALTSDPDNAVAFYLLGVALAGNDEPDSARVVLARALELDPGVERKLTPRLAESPSLRAKVDAVLGRSAAQAKPPTPTATAPAAPTAQRATPPVETAAFRVGDMVEIRAPGSGEWERGAVVGVDDEPNAYGRYTYRVRRRVVANDPSTEVESKFYPNDVRAARTGAATQSAPAARKAGGLLALGTYACTYDSWSGAGAKRTRISQPKGSLTLKAGGTYTYLDNGGTGRYRYDATTGAIVWLSGPIAQMSPDKTTFIRNRNTAQIDIRMKDVYEWSCGRNVP